MVTKTNDTKGQASKKALPPLVVDGVRLGKRSLGVRGLTQKYYAGGIGVYLAEDVFDFSGIVLKVYSPEKNSSMVRIELFDDDNGIQR